MTRFVCISDTHEKHRQIKNIPDGDVLLCAGDFTNESDFDRIVDFNAWLGGLPHKHKVVVSGNHDLFFDHNKCRYPGISQQYIAMLSNATHYLDSSGCEIEGIKIWGEPRQPAFFNWAFNVDREQMKEVWERVPHDTNILLTHGPPLSYGDFCPDMHDRTKLVRVGCKYQKELIEDYRCLPNLKAVVCGHVHMGHGIYQIKGRDSYVYNASICDERYYPSNAPIVFDLEN